MPIVSNMDSMANNLLAPERKGRARKSGGVISGLVVARPLRPVKQCRSASPCHHSVISYKKNIDSERTIR